ncbi:MAG TPA: GNAT family N-acetyltransferase [Candidatus Nanoarchaeia archaeon]|nr:GNAT family N-acetyltransferase [Candidatus Nanoarchaeia archaeon]
MKGLQIKIAKDSKEIKDCFKVRYKVFTLEQKIPENIDKEGLDNSAEHVLAYFDNEPSGYARIKYIDRKAKLERVATLKEYRGKGIGMLVIKKAIEKAKDNGKNKIVLDSQYEARIFYEKLGFKTRGKTFY